MTLQQAHPLEDEGREYYRVLHGSWDPRTTDTHPAAVSREFGKHAWLVVPLSALVIVAFLWFVSSLPGVMG